MVQMVVHIAPDHDIKEDNILRRNFVEYVACDSWFSASSIGPHEFNAQRCVRMETLVDEDAGMEFLQCFDIWDLI